MLSVSLTVLMALNTFVLRIGRHLAWIALGFMVLVILIQVFYRYALNNALPWPDEAARFLMLWMAGLMAPSAMRWSGPRRTRAPACRAIRNRRGRPWSSASSAAR